MIILSGLSAISIIGAILVLIYIVYKKRKTSTTQTTITPTTPRTTQSPTPKTYQKPLFSESFVIKSYLLDENETAVYVVPKENVDGSELIISKDKILYEYDDTTKEVFLADEPNLAIKYVNSKLTLGARGGGLRCNFDDGYLQYGTFILGMKSDSKLGEYPQFYNIANVEIVPFFVSYADGEYECSTNRLKSRFEVVRSNVGPGWYSGAYSRNCLFDSGMNQTTKAAAEYEAINNCRKKAKAKTCLVYKTKYMCDKSPLRIEKKLDDLRKTVDFGKWYGMYVSDDCKITESASGDSKEEVEMALKKDIESKSQEYYDKYVLYKQCNDLVGDNIVAETMKKTYVGKWFGVTKSDDCKFGIAINETKSQDAFDRSLQDCRAKSRFPNTCVNFKVDYVRCSQERHNALREEAIRRARDEARDGDWYSVWMSDACHVGTSLPISDGDNSKKDFAQWNAQRNCVKAGGRVTLEASSGDPMVCNQKLIAKKVVCDKEKMWKELWDTTPEYHYAALWVSDGCKKGQGKAADIMTAQTMATAECVNMAYFGGCTEDCEPQDSCKPYRTQLKGAN